MIDLLQLQHGLSELGGLSSEMLVSLSLLHALLRSTSNTASKMDGRHTYHGTGQFITQGCRLIHMLRFRLLCFVGLGLKLLDVHFPGQFTLERAL
jgi:hypothetical protein